MPRLRTRPMKAEVKHSAPKACMRCGGIVRIKYVNGKNHCLVEVDPIHKTTEKNPNPIYQIHQCTEADGESTIINEELDNQDIRIGENTDNV